MPLVRTLQVTRATDQHAQELDSPLDHRIDHIIIHLMPHLTVEQHTLSFVVVVYKDNYDGSASVYSISLQRRYRC